LIFASVLIALISLIWVATYSAYSYPISAAIPALNQLTTVVGLVVLARTRRFGVLIIVAAIGWSPWDSMRLAVFTVSPQR
jgi:hypothetical protein